MITHTTATLSAKLAKGLGLDLKRVAICSGDHLLGKIKEKGFKEHEVYPAMSVMRTGMSINKDNVCRSVVARKGMKLSVDKTEGYAQMVHCLPILLPYSISIFYADSNELDKTEANFLWFMEDGKNTQLPILIEIDGQQLALPIEIKPPSARDVVLTRTKEEQWESAKCYRLDIELEVTSFSIRTSVKPIILEIDYKILEDNEILILPEPITKKTIGAKRNVLTKNPRISNTGSSRGSITDQLRQLSDN
jgi:hypothetical protein